ncbi:glycosyltransferase family 2 protein [Seonamhaeicola marinus]|uniref:Glycosyltransferase family 2 protein n=1 Tax=Seonamhaeicola marinus TaxID=1912246 RepID=A0A5D0HJE8_9FLAO|nr:glycosyltransferase family 2 protein [Seonamhaeicola marinus]TYA71375.1 glycosyltransferase family 2 protein [Seonamhaeicola marinus]
MKLSVIILNYNVRYFLELCLKSVQAAIHQIDAEIIVVDNNSEDDSCQMVRTFFPEVTLIQNKENYGFSKGNNIGVRQAKGEYICILNPDTVVPEDVFINLLKSCESRSKLGAVGCKLIDGVGRFLPESKRNVPVIKASFKKMMGNSKLYYANHLEENEEGEIDVLVGAFMLMKKKVYDEVGGFDEDYFMYGEDIDLSFKLLKEGYQNYYYGKTSILHFKGESTLKDRLYAKRFYGAMQIFYKKHFRQNLLFDALVWFGIQMAYFFRKIPKRSVKKINRYILLSKRHNEKLQSKLLNNIFLEKEISNFEKSDELIFDANVLTHKEIISSIEKYSKNNSLTFKILPNKASFILGSDTAISRGEIIEF